MSSISMVERGGVEQVEPAPRQHALQARASIFVVALPGRAVEGLQACVARQLLALRKSAARFVPMALHQMVVDHADRLHEGIDDGRADKV